MNRMNSGSDDSSARWSSIFLPNSFCSATAKKKIKYGTAEDKTDIRLHQFNVILRFHTMTRH